MTRDKLIERIRKLLALADNNPNEHEALAAAMQAQRLIAKFGVDDAELSDADGSDYEIAVEPSAIRSNRQAVKQLGGIVAVNFRCKAYVTKENEESGGYDKACHLVFYGRSCDAAAARLTFDFLAKVMLAKVRDECAKARARYGSARGVEPSVCVGFLKGVRSELEKQSKALMLVIPQDVNDSWERFCDDMSMGKAFKPRRVSYYREFAEEGERCAVEAIRSRRIDDGDADVDFLPA